LHRAVAGVAVGLTVLESMVMTQQKALSMPLEEAMRTQRSIRRIKSDPVDDSLVLHILELAMKAPTGSNAQNWEFIVVKDREVVAKLGRLNRRALNLFGPIYKRMIAHRRPRTRLERTRRLLVREDGLPARREAQRATA
jgi:nitroreductase